MEFLVSSRSHDFREIVSRTTFCMCNGIESIQLYELKTKRDESEIPRGERQSESARKWRETKEIWKIRTKRNGFSICSRTKTKVDDHGDDNMYSVWLCVARGGSII